MLNIIKLLFFIFLLLAILIFSSLFIGIKIDSFSFGNLNISQFYIKLDKKLILDIEKINFKSKKSKVKNSFDDLKKNIELLPKVLKYFKLIKIEQLEIDGNFFTIQLNDKLLFLDNKYVNIASKLKFDRKKVIFDLYSIYLKDLRILFNGRAKVDYLNHNLTFLGEYIKNNIKGKISIDSTKNILNFKLNSGKFKSLKFLKEYISLPKIAEEWMYDKVKGDLKIEELKGSFNIKENKLLKNSLSGKATVYNAKIRFHKKTSVVNTSKVDIKFIDNALFFKLDKPKYEDIPIDGSYVTINHLTSAKQGNVEVIIKAKAKLNKQVLNILKAYKIKLPILQKSGLTTANLYMKFPYSRKNKTIIDGEFDISNASIFINKFNFKSKKAKILLNNNIVSIKKAHFEYKNMIYANNVNLKLNTKTLNAKGDGTIVYTKIKDSKDDILNLKNFNTKLDLNFSKKTTINLINLKTVIKVDKNLFINIKDLSILYPYSKLLKTHNLKEGNIFLKIIDDKNIRFTSYLPKIDLPLEKDGKKIKNLHIMGSIKNNILSINSKNNDIKITLNNDLTTIRLKNLDLIQEKNSTSNSNLSKLKIEGENIRLLHKDNIYYLDNLSANFREDGIFFQTKINNLDIPLIKKNKKVKSLFLKGSIKNNKLNISTLNSDLQLKIDNKNVDLKLKSYDIIYNTDNKDINKEYGQYSIKAFDSNIRINNKYNLLSDSFELQLRENRTFLHLNYGKTDITFKKDNKENIDILANDVSAKFLNALYDKKIIKYGKIMLIANGKLNKIKGKVLLQNTKIEDFSENIKDKKKDEYSMNDYKIEQGTIDFIYNHKNKLLNIEKLISIGNGMDFDGKGTIDIKNMKIDSKIKLIFLKDYSKIIGIIPVVNYILLGKNRRVETEVNIKGDLNNPKITTNIAQDTLSIPINIVGRILTSPVKLVQAISKEVNKK